MSLIVLSMLACRIVNDGYWCAEPKSSRVELSISRSKIESTEEEKYFFVENIEMETIIKALYSAPKPMPPRREGCKLTTDTGKEYIYESDCEKLRRKIKGQK